MMKLGPSSNSEPSEAMCLLISTGPDDIVAYSPPALVRDRSFEDGVAPG